MNIKITPFTNDGEKMRDFFDLTKEEFLESYFSIDGSSLV